MYDVKSNDSRDYIQKGLTGRENPWIEIEDHNQNKEWPMLYVTEIKKDGNKLDSKNDCFCSGLFIYIMSSILNHQGVG